MSQEPSDHETEKEANELERHLRRQAEQWRRRLRDPQVMQQVIAGSLQVSPLVSRLLRAFPSSSPK